MVRVDKSVEQLVSGLEKLGLSSCVNMIIVADHGGATAGFDKLIKLNKYIPNLKDKVYFYGGPFSRLVPKSDKHGNVLDLLFFSVVQL